MKRYQKSTIFLYYFFLILFSLLIQHCKRDIRKVKNLPMTMNLKLCQIQYQNTIIDLK